MNTVNSRKVPPLRPKILLYGDSGAGKTTTALQLPGRKLVIDGEQGATAYAQLYDFDMPAGPDGTPFNSDNPEDLEAVIDALLDDPGPYTVLIIDPLTTFYSRAVEIADATLRQRDKRNLSEYDTAMHVGAWGAIKRHIKRMFSKLRRLDMAVVLTCREKTTLEPTPDGGFRKGDAIPDFDRSISYEVDHSIRLRAVGDRRIAYAQKTRGANWNNTIVEDFNAEVLVKMLGADGFTRTAEPRPLLTADQSAALRDLVEDLQITAGALARALSKRNANSIEELSPDQAAEMIMNLEAVKAKNAAAAADQRQSETAATAAGGSQ